MIVLGLSFGYHDSCVSVIKDGEIIYTATEQIFSRQKHDSSFPHSAIKNALEETNLKIENIDKVTYHEDPYLKFSRVLTSAFSGYPNTYKEFKNAMKTWLGKRLWVFNDISTYLNIPLKKISYLNHHDSHAVQAFLTSGFKDSACLIIDAVGDWSCTSLYDCCWENEKPVIKKIEDIQFPNSLGLLYSTFTSFLGFQPNSDECSVMALAAFGKPIYLKQIEEIALDKSGNNVEINTKYLNFSGFYSQPYTHAFIELLGSPRSPLQKMNFSSFNDGEQSLSETELFYVNIASSIQAFFEKQSLKYLEKAKRLTNRKSVCLAGGGALNCVNNSRMKDSGIFENIYIPPDPGDGGTSFGCALYYDALNSRSSKKKLTSAYVGPDFNRGNEDISKVLSSINVKRLVRYAKHGFENKLALKWKTQQFDKKSDLTNYVAIKLNESNIVGWVQGKNEVGPRALGNRSILIRPDSVELAMRLSREVKDRACFRPYALTMTNNSAKVILDIPEEDHENHRWMQFSAPVKPEIVNKVRSGIHVDKTTRPQICFKEDNALLYELLESFGKESGGLEAVVNTSFNESGYPIVQNTTDALIVFARTTMDCLVLGDLVIEKEK